MEFALNAPSAGTSDLTIFAIRLTIIANDGKTMENANNVI
jgi:hypothetical protein